MDRPEALRILKGALAVPALATLSPEEAWDLGREIHARLDPVHAGGVETATSVLSRHQLRTLGAIAEGIIPATESPGATAARVPEFIDLVLAEWYGEEDRNRFLMGLADVNARSRVAYGADFADLDELRQRAILAALDAPRHAGRFGAGSTGAGSIGHGAAPGHASTPGHAATPGRGEEGPEYFRQMKSLTVHGFCTSDLA